MLPMVNCTGGCGYELMNTRKFAPGKVVPTAVMTMETAVLAGFQIAHWSAICGHHIRVASQAVPPT